MRWEPGSESVDALKEMLALTQAMSELLEKEAKGQIPLQSAKQLLEVLAGLKGQVDGATQAVWRRIRRRAVQIAREMGSKSADGIEKLAFPDKKSPTLANHLQTLQKESGVTGSENPKIRELVNKIRGRLKPTSERITTLANRIAAYNRPSDWESVGEIARELEGRAARAPTVETRNDIELIVKALRQAKERKQGESLSKVISPKA